MKNIIFLFSFLPSVAMATLGGDIGSVDQDISTMKGQRVNTVSTLNLPTGCRVVVFTVDVVTVKEFLDASGHVFAVSWSGITHPDLAPLLGDLYGEFAELEKSVPKGRRTLRRPLVTSKITVTRGGHSMALHGTAILNGKLPPGMYEEDLL